MPLRYLDTGLLHQSPSKNIQTRGIALTQKAKRKMFSAAELREYRQARKESQTKFWGRFGVTQSRGSRFELGLEIPKPISILLKLYVEGAISDRDLYHARAGHAPRLQGNVFNPE